MEDDTEGFTILGGIVREGFRGIRFSIEARARRLNVGRF